MGQQTAAGPGSGNIQQAQGSTNQSISPYYVGPGVAGTDYAKMVGNEYQNITGAGNPSNRFTDMFNNYLAVANRGANQQMSKINAGLGSRGALYSSANMGQQATMRQQTAADIANTASQYQTTLENQRQAGLGQVLNAQSGIATAEYGAREAAMGRAYNDYLQQSQVPPLMAAGAQWGSGRPQPGSVAY